MRTRLIAVSACALVALAYLWRETSASAQVTNPQPTPAADQLQSITLVFGAKDVQPTAWDGSVALSTGSIERLAGYHFNDES